MCACLSVCLCVCVSVCLCVHARLCVSVSVSVRACVHVCLRTLTYLLAALLSAVVHDDGRVDEGAGSGHVLSQQAFHLVGPQAGRQIQELHRPILVRRGHYGEGGVGEGRGRGVMRWRGTEIEQSL